MLMKISIELQTFSLQVIALQENACSSALKDEHVHFCRSEKEGKKKKHRQDKSHKWSQITISQSLFSLVSKWCNHGYAVEVDGERLILIHEAQQLITVNKILRADISVYFK